MYQTAERRPPVVIDFPTGQTERTRRYHAYEAMSTRVPQLLIELLKPYAEVRVPTQGGQKLRRHDRLFATGYRTFLNKLLHMVCDELKKQEKLERIEWAPRPNAVCEYIHDAAMIPILEDCLARCARPVRKIEKIVCILI